MNTLLTKATKYLRPLALAAATLLAAGAAFALPASVYPAASPLASGRWVRVTTDAEGIYQLTEADLRSMGFDDPAKVTVWTVDHYALSTHTFSEDLAKGLHPVAAMHTADGRLLFYGNGEARLSIGPLNRQSKADFTYERNYYDRHSSYLLTDSRTDGALATAAWAEPTSAEAHTSHVHTQLVEEELSRPTAGGVMALGRSYEGGETIPFTFHIKNWQAGPVDQYALVYYSIATASDAAVRFTAATPEGMKRITYSNLIATNVQYPDAYSPAEGWMMLSPAEGEDWTDRDLVFNVPTASRTYSLLAADHAMLAYPRANVLDEADPALVMTLASGSAAGQELVFSGADAANLHLWLVDDPFNALDVEGKATADASGVTFTLPREATRAVAFDASATYPSPAVAGAIPNSNLAASAVPELVILTTDALRPAAERLAALHRSRQGIDVLVVTQREIDREFSAGAHHAMAFRLFVKSLYDRDPAKMRYVLMFGPSYNDVRGIANSPDFETIATFQCDNPTYNRSHVLCYTSDSYFGMLADDCRHSNLPMMEAQVAVGRVSARMVSQANDYVTKATAWFDNPPTPGIYSSGILVSGGLNKNDHVNHTLEVQREMTAIKSDFQFTQVPFIVMPGTMTGSTTTLHSVLIEALRRGAGYMSYSGHGAINYINSLDLLSTGTVTSEPYTYPPFVMLSSCAQFTFDKLGSSLMETMVLYPQGGAIAGVAATREVYLSYNQYTCLSVGQAYADAKPGATVGSVYLDARRRVLSRVAVNNTPWVDPPELINNMCYNLAGDPAMPLYVPSQEVRLDAVEAFEPVKEVKLPGAVYNADGTVDTSFNGTVQISVYDGVHSEPTQNVFGDADFSPVQVALENDLIGTALATVADGRFEASLSVSEPFYGADSYRALLSAVRSDSFDGGAVGTANLRLLPVDPEVYESATAPVINAFYAEDPGFTSGDLCGSSFTLYAEIDPGEAGINFATAGITARTSLLLDGITSTAGIEGNFIRRPDGTVLLAVPVIDLADGYHTYELTVANNAGLVSRASLNLMVLDRDLKAAVAVAQDCVDTEAVLDIDTEVSDLRVARLVITNAMGNTVHSVESPAMPYTWNLTDGEGATLSAGEYKVQMYVASGLHRAEATPGRFVKL